MYTTSDQMAAAYENEAPSKSNTAQMLSACDTGLVHSESNWRCPKFLKNPAQVQRGYVSQWNDNSVSVREEQVDAIPDFYTIALAKKRTNATFYVADSTAHHGNISIGMSHVTAPNEPARAIFRAPCEFIHLFVSARFVSQCFEDLDLPQRSAEPKFERSFKYDAAIERLINALNSPAISPMASGRLYLDGICLAVVIRLFSAHVKCDQSFHKPKFSPLPQWRLKRSVEYIEANIAEPLSLADVAASSGLTRMYFAAQFRASTGMRPHDYIVRRRVERAQEIILNSDLSLVETSLSVGFQTQAHFTTVFKKIVGQTPHRWREENRRRTIAAA